MFITFCSLCKKCQKNNIANTCDRCHMPHKLTAIAKAEGGDAGVRAWPVEKSWRGGGGRADRNLELTGTLGTTARSWPACVGNRCCSLHSSADFCSVSGRFSSVLPLNPLLSMPVSGLCHKSALPRTICDTPGTAPVRPGPWQTLPVAYLLSGPQGKVGKAQARTCQSQGLWPLPSQI